MLLYWMKRCPQLLLDNLGNSSSATCTLTTAFWIDTFSSMITHKKYIGFVQLPKSWNNCISSISSTLQSISGTFHSTSSSSNRLLKGTRHLFGLSLLCFHGKNMMGPWMKRHVFSSIMLKSVRTSFQRNVHHEMYIISTKTKIIPFLLDVITTIQWEIQRDNRQSTSTVTTWQLAFNFLHGYSFPETLLSLPQK